MNRRQYLVAAGGVPTAVRRWSTAASDASDEEATGNGTTTFLTAVGGGRSRAIRPEEMLPSLPDGP